MFLNYADSPYDKQEGNMDKNKSIVINSCGTYRLETLRELPTCRPCGRADYQLIYIAEGRGFFYFGCDEPTIVESGNMVLYRPGEFQKYIYYGADRPNVYWIHFTGAGAEEIFKRFGIDVQGNIISAGNHPDYSQAFSRIISELQLQKEFYEESAALIFMQLIMGIGRCMNETDLINGSASVVEIDLACEYFHEHYQENINIEDYIESRGMSASWFFRKFKEKMGVSPLQYILEIRLDNAKQLLRAADYSINEIATIVGYDNALYFSRLFRKHVGVPPREYRRAGKTSQTLI